MANTKKWLSLFFLATITNLIGEIIESRYLELISKPLLMITLAIYFILATKDHPSTFRTLIIVGLFFAFGGDTLLMFASHPESGQTFFMLGLGSFLITQLCYMLAFFKYNADKKGLLQKQPFLILLFLAFLIGNTIYMWPDLPTALRIPVAAYSTIIIGMAASCVNLSGRILKTIFPTLLLGVLLFVISDNIIALSKFKGDQLSIPYAGLLIMSTYIAAQYLIATRSVQLAKLENAEASLKVLTHGN